jgi:hypothetical protein
MDLGAFVSLEDISDALPSYEEVVSAEMDPILAKTSSKSKPTSSERWRRIEATSR